MTSASAAVFSDEFTSTMKSAGIETADAAFETVADLIPGGKILLAPFKSVSFDDDFCSFIFDVQCDKVDHVHVLLSIPPKVSVSSFMGHLKGKSALMMFDKHANIKYKFGNRHFWAEGYYVSTVGLNESTIRKYIQDQEKADIALDKLSVKEYEDPFAR